MARGPKKHLKLLNAPHHWMLHKLNGIFAPRPSSGPHKLRECLPVTLILRNRLKYALTRREVQSIAMRRLLKIDHKVRTDVNYPAGFMDVLQIERTGENFRLLYDTKGRFSLVRIEPAEAQFKILKIRQVSLGAKSYMGRNPLTLGVQAAIPYVVTHDGRTIRYPHPKIQPNDSVKFDLKTQKIVDHLPFEIGSVAMVTGGANRGRVGVVTHRDVHNGVQDMVHLRDKRGNDFTTIMGYVFVIGKGDKPMVTLPKQRGISLSILEEREKRLKKKH